MKHASPPTLQDIATAAGVSTATVSRVLNRPDDVRPALREKVEAQIRSAGYVRHGAARALASAKSFTMGAVIPTLESAIFSTDVNAMQHRLDENGYTLLLAVTNYDPAHELRQVRQLIERGIDGMILVGYDHLPETINLLERHQCPYVMTWNYREQASGPCVGFDNIAAMIELTNHLLDLGHRRFAMIAGITAGNDRARDRILGVRQALSARGLELPERLIIEKPYEVWEGRLGLRALLSDRSEDRPTAVVCGNDVLAIGAMLEAQQMGLSVPKDLSVVGFDDLPISESLIPPLTTIRIPSRRMGKCAAEYLLDYLAGNTVAQQVELPTQLMVRRTTAAPSNWSEP